MNNANHVAYATLKNDIVALVSDLRRCENNLTSIADRMKEMGISIKPEENESEISFLQRVATFCNTREFELLEQQEREAIRQDMASEPTVGSRVRRTGLGRFLNRLSAIAG